MRARFLDRSSILLVIIFVVSAALIFFMMGLAYKHFQNYTESSEWMTHSYDNSMDLERLYSNIKDIETERRNYILTKDPESRNVVKQRITDIFRITTELRKKFKSSPAQTKNLDDLEMMIQYKYKIVQQSFSGELSDDPQKLTESLLSGKNVMASIYDKVEEMLHIETNLLNERKSQFYVFQKSTPIYLYVIALFSLGLLVFSFFRINRDVKTQKKINSDLQLSLNTSSLSEDVGEFGIWTMDLENKKVNFSKNLYQILEFQPNGLLDNKTGFIQKAHPNDKEMVSTYYHNVLNGIVSGPFKYRILNSSGEEKHLLSIVKQVTTLDDRNIILGITSDVTQEIENQVKLQKVNTEISEQNKELSISNETYAEGEKIGWYGSWRYSKKEKEYNFSDNLIRLYGFDPKNFDHKLAQLFSTTHPDDVSFLQDNLKKILRGEEVPPFTYRILRHNDGSLHYMNINSKWVTNELGGDYLLVITSDISEEYLDKRNIQEQNRILEANNKELQAFNYVASHDLQEPLRKIETFISRLQDKDQDKLSDAGQQYLDRIQFSAGRMRKLIDDLLQFSRTTRAEKTFEVVDLNEILELSIEPFAHIIAEKNAEIIHNNLPNEISAVPFQIQQLFTNLIGNSLKYNREGVPPKIIITSHLVEAEEEPRIKDRTGNFIKITFEDNGIGFKQEYAEKIFELFNRLHGKLEYEGTGIGLAICKKIVENHSGYIFAESVPDKGSTFTVYLPGDL